MIRTRVGHKITFDDNDGAGGIEILDKNQNSIKIDTGSDTLKIKVKGKVTIEAQSDVTIETKAKCNLTATGSVEIKGMSAKLDGGGGTVTVKGTMVNIN